MATLTARIASSVDGSVAIDAEYNSNGFDIRAFILTNNGGGTMTVTVTKDGTQGSWTLTAGPGQTVRDTLPANLVSFPDDGTGNPAIPSAIPIPSYWVGEFGIWHWLVTG